jgi:prophage regulatory protein
MSNCKKQIHTSLHPPLAPLSGLRRKATAALPADTAGRPTEAIRILRLPQVLDVTGLGKTKIYELQAAGHFPMRLQITRHSVGWIEREVQAWLAQRVAARPVPRIEVTRVTEFWPASRA